MGAEATAWALRCKTRSPRAKAVLMILAMQANASGDVCESIDVIAWATEQSVASVRKQLIVLRDLGLIQMDREVFQLAVSARLPLAVIPVDNVIPFPSRKAS